MDVSSLNNLEYVQLVGHYSNVGNKGMESQLIEKNYSPERIALIKSKFDSLPVQTIRSLNVEFKTNEDIVYPHFGYYYGLYRQYSDNGVMPFDGCLADQPSKIIEIFDVFEQLKDENEQKQMKEAQKNA